MAPHFHRSSGKAELAPTPETPAEEASPPRNTRQSRHQNKRGKVKSSTISSLPYASLLHACFRGFYSPFKLPKEQIEQSVKPSSRQGEAEDFPVSSLCPYKELRYESYSQIRHTYSGPGVEIPSLCSQGSLFHTRVAWGAPRVWGAANPCQAPRSPWCSAGQGPGRSLCQARGESRGPLSDQRCRCLSEPADCKLGGIQTVLEGAAALRCGWGPGAVHLSRAQDPPPPLKLGPRYCPAPLPGERLCRS